MANTSVQIRVPATTSNLGPGFDSLGLALQLYNYFDLTLRRNGDIEVFTEFSGVQHDRTRSMVCLAARAFFKASGLKPRGFSMAITSDIPVARGLGGSSTVVAAVLSGLNRLLGVPLLKQDLLNLGARIEGHPDNIVPAMLGGFAVASYNRGKVFHLRAELPCKLKFVVLIPDFEMETRQSRGLLPEKYPRPDVMRNINQASLLTGAMILGKFSLVSQCLDDRLHQPYRSRLVPELYSVINAGQNAGALGGWLSGAGSTICCVTLEKAALVARSMKRAFNRRRPGGQTRILAADNVGVKIN